MEICRDPAHWGSWVSLAVAQHPACHGHPDPTPARGRILPRQGTRRAAIPAPLGPPMLSTGAPSRGAGAVGRDTGVMWGGRAPAGMQHGGGGFALMIER